MQDNIEKNKEFQEIISDIIINKKVQEMKNYRQHGNIDCYEHCYNVAYECYYICKKLNLDYISATRAAMLHDLFLYDWRKKSPEHKSFHAFHHGKIAYKNAVKEFSLNDKEKDCIVKHMWPVIIIPPKYLEGYILTLVDKHCTLVEMLNYYRNKYRKNFIV